MSGHSKWSTIKRKKGAVDAKRGKIFSKLAKEISVAAKIGGEDPDGNPRLRTVLLAARAFNMPKDNVDKAIKKGAGTTEGVVYEEARYEAYGPGGGAIIIEVLTDNKNRTVADVRHGVTLRLEMPGPGLLETSIQVFAVWSGVRHLYAIGRELCVGGMNLNVLEHQHFQYWIDVSVYATADHGQPDSNALTMGHKFIKREPDDDFTLNELLDVLLGGVHQAEVPDSVLLGGQLS